MDRSPTLEGRTDADGASVSFISLVNVLLRHRRLLVALPVATALLAAAYVMLQPRQYIADSSFMPRSASSGANRLAGLAAQFGVSVGGSVGEEQESPQFYAELIMSREVLRTVATSRYTFQAASEEGRKFDGTLVELYDPDGATAEGRIRQVMGTLRQTVVATPDPTVGIVTLTVRAPWPELAELINARLLELVNDFNLRRRQSQARAERELADANLAKARAELATSERELQRFLQQNRQYEGSPQLTFEMRRLQRQVDFQQQVVTSLATATAQAQLAEVRNTPVVTVIDRPQQSARRSSRSVVMVMALAIFLGFLVAAMLSFLLDYFQAQRHANPDDFAEFEALKRSAVPSLSSLGVRPFRNARSER